MGSALPEQKALGLPPSESNEVEPGWPDAADEADRIVVALSDLISDANGEVVLYNDSGLRSLAVSTDAAVVGRGEAGRHVTAAGEDVSGFRYLAFENGLKLYFRAGLDLVLVHHHA